MHDIEDYGAEVSVWGAIPFSGIIEQDKFLMLCMILKIMGQKRVYEVPFPALESLSKTNS
jgi:hypothetical protein